MIRVWGFFTLLTLSILLCDFSEANKTLGDLIRADIEKQYPAAEIELGSTIRWVGLSPRQSVVRNIRFLGENGHGEAHFVINEGINDLQAEGWISFSAWMSARFANRRIFPGEKILESLTTTRKIDVSRGIVREMRGLILSEKGSVQGLESRQTILEGQFLTTTAVEKTPDVRRGDAIRIHLIAGDLTLVAPGKAEQPSYVDHAVKVTANQTKRTLEGKLRAGGIVEVRL